MRTIAVSSIALLFAASTAAAGEKVSSGLKPGARAGAFNVKDVTGPNKGKSLCYR